MPFRFSSDIENLLFYGFDIHSTLGMVAVSLAMFCLSFLSEGLKYFRMGRQSQSSWPTDASPNEGGEFRPLLSSNYSRVRQERWRRHQSNLTLAQKYFMYADRIFLSGMYLIQTVVTYALMLAVMSYSVWLFLAAIAGTGCGSWFFQKRYRNQTQSKSSKASDQVYDQSGPIVGYESIDPGSDEDPDAPVGSLLVPGDQVVTVEVHHNSRAESAPVAT
eukprot:maker-scaffold1233_size54137-snap-gene-0.11 protein:Tk05992 transcript:maker-scaffold1233_size54137-snap-gene-0.11-mRNA-1 annotation:"high-affinity copper uptake protein copper transporter solute carrier family 31 member 1"